MRFLNIINTLASVNRNVLSDVRRASNVCTANNAGVGTLVRVGSLVWQTVNADSENNEGNAVM